MGQRAVFEFGEDLLDQGVITVRPVGIDGAQGRVRDERVEAPGREQLALVFGGLAIAAPDSAYDQATRDFLLLACGLERHVRDLRDLRVADQLTGLGVGDRPWVGDRRPRRIRDLGDRGLDRDVLTCSDREPRPPGPGRGHRGLAVVRAVSAHHQPPTLTALAAAGGRDAARRGDLSCRADQRRGPAAAGGVPLPQPRRGDHRRRDRGRQRRDLRVQTLQAGVAIRRTLLGVPMDLADRVIDIQIRDRARPRQQRRDPSRQPHQEITADSAQLPHVLWFERPQERPQRRGCAHTAEHPAHPAMTQHVQIIDAVCPGQHPRHHARGLHRRRRRVHPQPLRQHLTQAGRFGQHQPRRKPRHADQILLIENGRQPLAHLHPVDAPLTTAR